MNPQPERSGRDHDFFALVAMLESRLGSAGGSPLDDGTIRFCSNTAHVFPSSDIAALEHTEGTWRFLLSFMGLCGVSSPLPCYFTEFVDRYPEEGEAMRDFLDMFSHRMYVLFYRAWKKYRFESPVGASSAVTFDMIAAALAGSSRRGSFPVPPGAAASMAGRCRSASGLEALLCSTFAGVDFQVRQWYPRWVYVENREPLGVSRLGADAFLGERFLQRSAGIRIVAGPLERESYSRFLPGGRAFEQMCSIVGEFCTDLLSFDVELKVARTELTPVVLGEDAAPLAITACLGRCHLPASIESVVVEPSPSYTPPLPHTK